MRLMPGPTGPGLLGCRAAGTAATAATRAAWSRLRRQGEGDELTRRLTTNREHDELSALVHIGHRHAARVAWHGDFRQVLAGLLVVRMQQRTSAATFRAEEQRLRHE